MVLPRLRFLNVGWAFLFSLGAFLAAANVARAAEAPASVLNQLSEDLARNMADLLARLPPPTEHFDGLTPEALMHRLAENKNYQELLREKSQDRWFAALVPLDPKEMPTVTARFETWPGLIDFIQEQDALVEVWAFGEGGWEKARRIPAPELAEIKKQPREQPSFVTVTYPDRATGQLHRERIEFGFRAAAVAWAAHQGYQRQRQLQLAVRAVLAARDPQGVFENSISGSTGAPSMSNPRAGLPLTSPAVPAGRLPTGAGQLPAPPVFNPRSPGKLSAIAQWEALQNAVRDGRIQIAEMPAQPDRADDLFVAVEFEIDASNNFSRVFRVYRESEIQKRIFPDREGRSVQVLLLRKPGDNQAREASGFGVQGVSDKLIPLPSPILGRDFVELRVRNPAEPDARRWNVLEFGEPEMLKQSALARFSLINAHLDRQRKTIALRKSRYDLVAEPIIAALNIGGGLSGVAFPIGDAGRLAYNLFSSQLIADIPKVKELRDLFATLAAKERHPELKTKPAEFLTREDIQKLSGMGRRLSDAEVEEYLQRISDDDLKGMLKLGRMGRFDARVTNFLNILTSAGKVSGVTESGLLRDIFNSVYFSLNGDINLKSILAVAVGQRVMTPLAGTSLESLSRGEGPAKAWAQFFDVSIDVRALVNTLSRVFKPTLARKELEKPFPYSPRMTDLAAYEFRLFGFPLLMFYKRGLMKEDYQAYDQDYAYGMIGARIVEHFATKEEMDAEIRAGRMAPLGYVRVWNGKNGWKETNLAVFAHRIPTGKHRGKTAVIIYGLRAYEQHSQFIERELVRFQQYEQALAQGAVIEQLVETMNASESVPRKSGLGSTGYQPVPSGNLPDGTGAALTNNPGAGLTATPPAIPVGRLPTGTGKLPALPILPAGSKRVPTDFEPIIHVGEKANDEFFTPLLSGLLEVRRYWLYKAWGLPMPTEELLHVATVLERLAVQGIWLEDRDPLAGVDKFNSTFFYRRLVSGQPRLVKMTLIPSLAEIDRALQKSDEAQRVEEIRREAIVAQGAGVVLINQATPVNGRFELGPLVSDRNNRVVGAGIASGAKAVEDILQLIDRLPVTDRARLAFNHFSATVVDLDADGDGHTEKLFLTIEFPIDRVLRRERTNPLTGQSEILIFDHGLWRSSVTADRIVELEYDEAQRETRGRTYFNRGTREQPAKGPLLEETRTLATWFRDLNQPNLDPYTPVIAKLRVNYVTGQTARETYGLFPSAVSTVDELFVTENRFNSQGLFDSAQVFENGLTDADFQRPPMTKLLEPIRGRARFRLASMVPNLAQLSSLAAQGYQSPVERTDLFKGLPKTIVIDLAHGGRVSSESYTDALDGGRSVTVTATRQYRDDFFFGFIPSQTTVQSGPNSRLVSEVTTQRYDPLARRLTGVEISYTGKVSTNVWDFRWENPVEVETALRRTLTQYNRDETSATGSTVAKPGNEEVNRFSAQYNPATKTWQVNRSLWYRPGILSRSETNTLNGFGKLLATRVGNEFEARPSYDGDGFETGRQLFRRNSATGRFEISVRREDDYRWQNGAREARVQTFMDGQAYDTFRAAADSEGRTILDGVRQWPALELKTVLTYDGASDRIARSEEFLNNNVRVTREVLPEQLQADGTYLLPFKSTPAWGLVSTQTCVIGDPLGRTVETVYENGARAQVREWFDGTALAKVSETIDRHGRIKERYIRHLHGGLEAGLPFDRTSRFQVSPWGGLGLAEEEASIQGTDVTLFTDSTDARTYFDLAKPYKSPWFAVDPAAERGVGVTLNQTRRSHVTALFRTRVVDSTTIDTNLPPQALLESETIDLSGLFFHRVNRRMLDRAGHILTETLGQISTAGESTYSDQALFAAAPKAKLTKLFRYRYDRGWLVERTNPTAGGRELVFTRNPAEAGPSGLAVNDGAWREFVTQIDGIQAASANEADSIELQNFLQRTHSPAWRERNPYLPECTNVWISWITTELRGDAQKLFDTETTYDAEGRLSAARTLKSTSAGEPATKITYQIPRPAAGALTPRTLKPGEQILPLRAPGQLDFSGSDFIYFYLTNPSNALWNLILTDRAGRKVTVGREDINPGKGVAPIWPINAANVRWLPNTAIPRHAALVDAPVSLLKNRNVIAISVPDLALAGLDVGQVETCALSVKSSGEIPLQFSPLFRLVRGGAFLKDAEGRHFSQREHPHSSGFKSLSTADRRPSDRALFSSQRTRSVVEYNGLPVAVTLDRGGHAPFPPIVVLDKSDPESPRPLYALSYEAGNFLEHYKTRRLGDVQVYTVVQGFDLPRFEVFDTTVLEDEVSPGFIAYGYDYHVTIKYAKGAGLLTQRLANLHNRVVANAFKYGSDRLLNLFSEVDAKSELLRRYNYALLHNAKLQASEIKDLPMLAQALLPARDVPWTNTAAVITGRADLPVRPTGNNGGGGDKEVGKAQTPPERSALGSTGYQPVPSGNLPDGTGATSINKPDAVVPTTPAPIPVGPLPTGAGRLPAPPIIQRAPQPDPTIDRKQLALELLKLHVTTNLPTTYLIPTSPQTAAARFVDTAQEAELIKLAVALDELSLARDLLEFYWNKSHGGETTLHESYDAQVGTAMASNFMFERPHHAQPTAEAQLAMADAAFSLGLRIGEARWLNLGRNLLTNLLEHFRPPVSTNQAPRGLAEHPVLPIKRSAFGLTFWPEAERYPLQSNARAYLLFKQLAALPQLFGADPTWPSQIRQARDEQEAWLKAHVIPVAERSGVVPKGLFQIQDINEETTALGVERWTAAEGWLTFLEAAHAMGLPPETTRRWLDNLARVHGVEVGGRWGLDWSLALLRPDAISPELTAHFLRVARLLGHAAAEKFSGASVRALRNEKAFPAVVTEAQRTLPLLSGQGFSIYPTANQPAWPNTFGAFAQLVPTPWQTNGLAQLANTAAVVERAPRTDLTVFILLTAAFYLSILGTSLFWWRFRALRKREVNLAIQTQLVPEAVMQRAEERWAKRVLGVQTPANAECTRFSNATLEQNFLMQLRAIYKLVLEWRRQENGWGEDDPRLAEDESDDWLNGLDEFASLVGLYMRFVIKAGVKDGFSRPDVLAENEDSNHIWSRLLMYFSEYYWALLTLLSHYNNLVTPQDKAGLYGEISQVLIAMGLRQRAASFDARTLFNFPANPLALDLLVIQKPGATLSKVFLDASMKLKIPFSHLAGFVEKYKAFKKREQPYPIHPYLIELAKVLPHFFLMGLGALVWYNQGIGDSPIVPYVWSLLSQLALDPANWTWGLPLLGSLGFSVHSYFTRIYRFEGSMLAREKPQMILDATVTSLFVKKHSTLPGIKSGRFWDTDLSERCGWVLRAAGFLGLGLRLLWEPTPSFATFLVVNGLFAMLAFAEVAGIVFPLAATALSKFLQDRVAGPAKAGPFTQFFNRLNITATRPASPSWLSIKYHNQPTVPSGDFLGLAQAIVFYFVLAATFFFVGAYLCQQIFSLWFTDMYLNAANWKLFLGALLFWNTMYLLRYGLFLMFTGVASILATFPIRGTFGLAALVYVGLALFGDALNFNLASHSSIAWTFAVLGVGLIVFEKEVASWLGGLLPAPRRRPHSANPAPPAGSNRSAELHSAVSQNCILRGVGKVERSGVCLRPADCKSAIRQTPSLRYEETVRGNCLADGTATLGVVYMGGDDLAYQKLTPALLMGRWNILRDKLDSEGLRLLFGLVDRPDDATLESWFKQLYETEKKCDVTLWHPIQICVAGESPRFKPESGLNLVVENESQRRPLLTAWHIRRWLVTMMSTAGHAQDTGVTLVDIALRLAREGLGANTVFYLIQNKYDNNDNNRPVQTPYDKGELGQRNKLARLLSAVAPGARAYSVQNWTPFGFKAGGLTGMDLVHEETLKLTTMLVLDRNATVHDLDALMEDLTQALTDPDLVIIIPGRGTTNTLTPLGQGSQMVEEGHRSFLKGLMALMGGTASESVGTGWGNLLAVFYGRVQRAMIDAATPKMPLTSRMRRGSSFAVRVEGLIGFAPHAVGISEDTWAVSQTAHNAMAFGRRVKFRLSRAFWHKIRETWSHAEWLASFPRWSGGFVQMMHDPIMQRINDFGPASVFAKEIRANSGRNFLSAPFALLNILLMPLAILLDLTPFVQILIVLWNFGFIMNQILTVHGLNTYLESCGFYRLPAALGGSLAGLGALAVPALRPFAPGLIILGTLYGGFLVGLNRWLYTRVRDVILFGPQLVLHTLGQIVRQSMEFTLSGASPEDAKGVNMSFRAWVGPREDRPLDGFPNFINLKTVVWIIGLLSVVLNLFALANLDMLNALLLLPSLLFSVSALIGPFVLRPKVGRPIGKRVAVFKALGWLASLMFYTAVSALIARGGGLLWLGVAFFVATFALVLRQGLKYSTYRARLRSVRLKLTQALEAAGLPGPDAGKLAQKIVQQTGGDAAKVQAVVSEGLPQKPALGSTGCQPVPSGNLLDGTGAASISKPGAGLPTEPAAVPVGKLPTGAGRLPAPPPLLAHSEAETDHHAAILQLAQGRLAPLLRQPVQDLQSGRFANSRAVSEFNRSFVLSLFVLIWFFIVPVPGLFVFRAGAYRVSMELWTILLLVGAAIGIVLTGSWLGQLVQWLDRRGIRNSGLARRLEIAYRSFQTLLQAPGQLTDQEISSLYALFTDVKTYLDQRSYAYASRSLGLIEITLRGASHPETTSGEQRKHWNELR